MTAVYTEKTLPTLEALISALNESNNNVLVSGDGLGDADIAAITSPGTVTKLRVVLAAIAALDYTGKRQTKNDFILSAYDLAAQPIFPVGIGTVTATPATSGGSLADGTYYFRVTALDRLGNQSAPSTEVSGVVSGGGGSGKVTLSIPATRGAVTFRIWFSTTSGTYTQYKAATTNGAITSSAFSYVFTVTTGGTSATIPTTNAAGYGYIADIDVETARATGTFASLMAQIVANHPQGTAMTSFIGGLGIYPYCTTASGLV